MTGWLSMVSLRSKCSLFHEYHVILNLFQNPFARAVDAESSSA